MDGFNNKVTEMVARTVRDFYKKKFDKKGLKKDFKKRYGKEGDAVMYATINKMAKKNA